MSQLFTSGDQSTTGYPYAKKKKTKLQNPHLVMMIKWEIFVKLLHRASLYTLVPFILGFQMKPFPSLEQKKGIKMKNRLCECAFRDHFLHMLWILVHNCPLGLPWPGLSPLHTAWPYSPPQTLQQLPCHRAFAHVSPKARECLPLQALGLPRWLSGKEPTCQCSRRRFNPWVGKIPWRRKWLLTPVFLPGESHG